MVCERRQSAEPTQRSADESTNGDNTTSAVLTALLARHNKNRDLAKAKSLFRKVSRNALHDTACKATTVCR